MLPPRFKPPLILSRLLLILPLLLLPARTGRAGQDQISLSMTAPALLHSLQALTPLRFTPDDPKFTGWLSLDRVERIRFSANTIEFSGTLSGHDINSRATIAGQSFTIKLGQVTLPVHCTLGLRYVPKTRRILIRPRCTPPDGKQGAEILLPLLANLEKQEYPLDPGALFTIRNPNDGKQGLRLEPAGLRIDRDSLTLRLIPMAAKSR